MFRPPAGLSSVFGPGPQFLASPDPTDRSRKRLAEASVLLVRGKDDGFGLSLAALANRWATLPASTSHRTTSVSPLGQWRRRSAPVASVLPSGEKPTEWMSKARAGKSPNLLAARHVPQDGVVAVDLGQHFAVSRQRAVQWLPTPPIAWPAAGRVPEGSSHPARGRLPHGQSMIAAAADQALPSGVKKHQSPAALGQFQPLPPVRGVLRDEPFRTNPPRPASCRPARRRPTGRPRDGGNGRSEAGRQAPVGRASPRLQRGERLFPVPARCARARAAGLSRRPMMDNTGL